MEGWSLRPLHPCESDRGLSRLYSPRSVQRCFVSLASLLHSTVWCSRPWMVAVTTSNSSRPCKIDPKVWYRLPKAVKSMMLF